MLMLQNGTGLEKKEEQGVDDKKTVRPHLEYLIVSSFLIQNKANNPGLKWCLTSSQTKTTWLTLLMRLTALIKITRLLTEKFHDSQPVFADKVISVLQDIEMHFPTLLKVSLA